MNPTAEQERLLVDDVVVALTNSPEGELLSGADFRDQMERAAADFDRRTAETFGSALVESLCEDPGHVRRLEALVILGLAHPQVVERYQVSLATEGRRLAVLLEQIGEEERARSLLELLVQNLPQERSLHQDLSGMMRRTGDVQELIERCLRNAEEQVDKGHPEEAIPWLREVLLHDPSRRDVARMIRDLRYQQEENRARSKRRFRFAVVLLLLSAVASSLLVRERRIQYAYEALPEVAEGDLEQLEGRLGELDRMIADNRIWLGMFRVVQERNDLRLQIDELEAERSDRVRAERRAQEERQVMAEAARTRALAAAQRGQFREALVDFRAALELSDESWQHRARVQADVDAITEWLREQGQD